MFLNQALMKTKIGENRQIFAAQMVASHHPRCQCIQSLLFYGWCAVRQGSMWVRSNNWPKFLIALIQFLPHNCLKLGGIASQQARLPLKYFFFIEQEKWKRIKYKKCTIIILTNLKWSQDVKLPEDFHLHSRLWHWCCFGRQLFRGNIKGIFFSLTLEFHLLEYNGGVV